MRRRTVTLVVVVLVQLALVGVAVAPRLSARVLGEEYLLRVGPVDPVDPFRGAYVDLSYPGLQPEWQSRRGTRDDAHPGGDRGRLYVEVEDTGGLLDPTGFTRERPTEGLYLTCDDSDWQVRCGIESLFLPQEDALAAQEQLGRGDGEVFARILLDGRGNAMVVGLEER